MADAFDVERLAKVETLIAAYDAALLSIIQNGAQSYSLDTGQTVTKVTKLTAGMLQKTLDSLLNQRTTLKTRCDGSGTTNVRPAW